LAKRCDVDRLRALATALHQLAIDDQKVTLTIELYAQEFGAFD
jgi:hypothetical protein